MNALLKWIIIQKVKALGERRRKMGKKYDWKKTLEKFLRGGGLAFVGTLIAAYTGKDPKVVAPLFTALGEAIWNIIKFFSTE